MLPFVTSANEKDPRVELPSKLAADRQFQHTLCRIQQFTWTSVPSREPLIIQDSLVPLKDCAARACIQSEVLTDGSLQL